MRYLFFFAVFMAVTGSIAVAMEQNNIKSDEQYTQAATQTPEEIDAQMKKELDEATTQEEKDSIIEKYKQIKDAAQKATEHLDTAPEVIDESEKLGEPEAVGE